MRVKVRLYGAPEYALETREIEVVLSPGAKVEQLLDQLPLPDKNYLYVVREGIRLDRKATLKNRDTVLIFPPIAGGSFRQISAAKEKEFSWIGRPIPRGDAVGKVTGRTKFFSDLSLPGMLWGEVLRSRYPHAIIANIDVSSAKKLPGVLATLTYEDVPGLNGFGIVIPDQPVLCQDKVRFGGDALALVAAETREIAEKALSLIHVDYEPLPLVTNPEEAMKPDAPRVHSKGNVLRHAHVQVGDVEKGLEPAELVLENTYVTGRQMHMFLEPEAGVGLIDESDNVVLYVGGQAPYRDQMQVARALGIPRERIRIISTPVGGAFGGKEEITVQIHLALLALTTRRPVKMVWSREESGAAGLKRHPMKITVKTGVAADGTLLANKVTIVSDTGAYASLGPTVLDVAMENCCGPYRIPNVEIDGYCVYTNNPVSGAFRGFGAPQANFAMESQMDLLAGRLGLDPVEIRRKNVLRPGDIGPFGNRVTGSIGVHEALERLASSELWKQRTRLKRTTNPWTKRGVGVSLAVKGCGFGALPDFAAASMEITAEGNFHVSVSCPEIGQGNTTAYVSIAAEALGCHIDRVRIVSADTEMAPDTGTSSASRSLYAGGKAIMAACEKMKNLLVMAAGQTLSASPSEIEVAGESLVVRGKNLVIELSELGRRMHGHGMQTKVEAGFVVPRVETPVSGTIEIPHLVYMYGALAILVEVDTLTGAAKVLRADIYPDAGRVINPQGLEGQCEGAFVQGLGFALMEDTLVEEGRVKTPNFTTYMIPTAGDVPEIRVYPVGTPEASGPYGAKGVGELALVPVASAVVNAIHDAVGIRLFRIPATPERVLEELAEAGLWPLAQPNGDR